MNLFGCSHCWVERKRVFTKPSVFIERFKTRDDTDSDVYGFTAIEFYCSKCTKVKHQRVVGDFTENEND